jgi:hypothetical protein
MTKEQEQIYNQFAAGQLYVWDREQKKMVKATTLRQARWAMYRGKGIRTHEPQSVYEG